MVRAFSPDDASLFSDGRHCAAHEVLGAQPGDDGRVTFRVWAPQASAVDVVGDMNDWTPTVSSALAPAEAGVWMGTLAARVGQRYKFRITPRSGPPFDKSDPFAFAAEEPPATASVIANLAHEWGDAAWMASRGARIAHDAPVSIYELHLGSWRYEPGGYRAIAPQLADHVAAAGFTHVELLPITEHPFYGSWGYQTTGYFAPTARYGTPADFKAFIDVLHQRGIGVILDWVPSHFPDDPHGLAGFDGTPLFERGDPVMGRHPDWDSCIFDYERGEVRSFLLSSAHFWIDEYHIDGLRVDAVASMLHLDYSRAEGEWIPNKHGGNGNLDAILFLQELNRTLGERHPDIAVIAEESTAWPGVTTPVDHDGLGFGYKWDMGWMHDTLQHLRRQPDDRRRHLGDLTFRTVYWKYENFVLPLSHDEVVHGKGSLLARMPGDRRQQLANLRLLLGYQWTTPGKKLLFMGGELGTPDEWQHEREIDWSLLSDPDHRRILDLVTNLNATYRDTPALHHGDHREDGFDWIVGDDEVNGVFAFVRRADGHPPALVAFNVLPEPREDHMVGVSAPGVWRPLLETDAEVYGGSGFTNGPVEASLDGRHGQGQSIPLRLGPLSLSIFTPQP